MNNILRNQLRNIRNINKRLQVAQPVACRTFTKRGAGAGALLGLTPLGSNQNYPWNWRDSGMDRRFFDKLERQMDDMFANVQGRQSFMPRVDIKETDTNYEITVDLPGVESKDLKVELEDGVLTISGKKETVSKSDNDKMHTSERFYGSFSRSWSVDPETTDDDISANFKNGVLNVTLKKKQPTPKQPSKKIDVKVDDK